MIRYLDDAATLTADRLGRGFFEGWPDPPSPELHLAHLCGAEAAIVAVDDATGDVVGFVTAIGDGVLAAFIPLLEVLPAYRGRGIGSELVRRVLDRLRDRYSVDLVCDPELVPFYERLGGRVLAAVGWRNREAFGVRRVSRTAPESRPLLLIPAASRGPVAKGPDPEGTRGVRTALARISSAVFTRMNGLAPY